MDEMNQFERRLEDRVRAFAVSGIQPIDSAAVARSVVHGRTRRSATRSSGRWFGLQFDRRAWSILLASSVVVLAVVLLPRLQSELHVGGSPEPTLTPTPTVTSSPGARLGLVYSLDGNIFVANSEGANPVRIADDVNAECGVFTEGRGIVSPDARYIAYRSRWMDDCPGTVYVTDPAGEIISTFPGVGWDISWSPDSTHLATWLEEDKTIGVYNIDGGLEAVLNETRMCCGDYDPIWSPDGAAAVLIKERGFGGVIFGVVWEIPVDGGTPVRVPAEDPRSSLGRDWREPPPYSPDRTRAVVIDSTMNIVAADGTDLEVLIDAAPGLTLGRAVWSPTGESIAYVESHPLTTDDDGSPGESTSVIRFVDPRTGTVTDSTATVSGRIQLLPIGFSPDGDRLLFSQDEEDGPSSLWVVNADGSGALKLVDGASEGGWVLLSED